MTFVDPTGLTYVSGNASLQFLFYLEMISGIPLKLGGKNKDVLMRDNDRICGNPFLGAYKTAETASLVENLLKGGTDYVWFDISSRSSAVAYGLGMKGNMAGSIANQYHSVDMGDISDAMSFDYEHGLGIFVHEVAEGYAEGAITNREFGPAHAFANKAEDKFLQSCGAGGLVPESDGTNLRTYKDGFQVKFRPASDPRVKTEPAGFTPRRGRR